MAKQRSFIMKYQYFYSDFNKGKYSKQRKKNRQLGKGKMRLKLKLEMLDMLEDYSITLYQ